MLWRSTRPATALQPDDSMDRAPLGAVGIRVSKFPVGSRPHPAGNPLRIERALWISASGFPQIESFHFDHVFAVDKTNGGVDCNTRQPERFSVQVVVKFFSLVREAAERLK